MNCLFFYKTKFDLPGDWNELPPKLLLRIISLSRDSFIAEQFHLKAFIELLLFSKKWYQRIYIRWKLYFLPTEEVYDLLILTAFLNDNKPTLSKNPFPFINILKKEKSYGHKVLTNSITFQEFYECEELLKEWSEKNSLEALRKLALVLYRPFENGKRVEITSDYKEEYLPKWQKVKEEYLLAIFKLYEFTREYYINAYPKIFTPPKDKADHKPKGHSNTWYNLVRSLADNDLEKQEKIQLMPLGTVLYETNRRLIENKKK